MSGSMVGGVVGGIIGFVASGGNPMGALYGFSIGSAVGAIVMPGTLQTNYGPRLDDLKAQSSTYGNPIPIVYGTVALQGTVIWAADIKEVATETHQGGGKGVPSQTTVNYSYYGSFAVAVCAGPIGGFLRIWAGPEKRLIYDGVTLEGGSVRFYLGGEDQGPDPLIEAHKGVGLAPSYRGTAYAVFEDFPLAKDGNRIPFLTFEVTTGDDGGTCGVDYVTVGTFPTDARLYDRPPVKLGNLGNLTPAFDGRATVADNDGNVYVVAHDENEDWFLKRVSSRAPIQEATLPLGPAYHSILQCKIAYDPNANVIGVIQNATKNHSLIDCASFSVIQYIEKDHEKTDIAYIASEGQFRFLNSQLIGDSGGHPDSYGITQPYATGILIDCGAHGLAIGLDAGLMFSACKTWLNGEVLTNLSAQFYDPARERLVGLAWGALATFTGYYDFKTGETVIPVEGADTIRIAAAYSASTDRYFYTGGGNLNVMNPADFSPASFADECTLISFPRMLYGDGVTLVANPGFEYLAIPLPGVRNMIAVTTNYSHSDIFLFPLGANGAGVSLASVVADLSERAGETRYDVSQLEADTVDGYVIARQTDVRSAIGVLRQAYYFDAVESQGIIKYVKRGGEPVAVIPDNDLGAHDFGSEPPDALSTARRMEVELPRAVTVKYMLAATDYSAASKQARRLIGSSGDEQTIEVPLVLTDAKAQEVAEVALHAAWAERLSYQFQLPRKYSYLEPTDLVVIKGHLMRLTKVQATPRGVLQCEALADESAFYTPHVVVTETESSSKTVWVPGVTYGELF